MNHDSERIAIIDDDQDVREGYAYAIEGDEFTPVDQPGPLGSLESYLARPKNATSAVSDHRLTPAGYAQFDGAKLVAQWYRTQFPAVLCTTYSISSADQFRSLRRWIPVVMSPNELSSDAVREGLAVVRAEFEGSFQAVRRPRRALVRFVEYVPENQSVYVKMPAWSSEAVALRVADLPPELALKVTTQPDYRAYAQVNLGTESADALYVADWEYDL